MNFAFHTFIGVHMHIHLYDELSATRANGEVLLTPGEWPADDFAKTALRLHAASSITG